MTAADGIFHPDFTPTPYWWEAYRPTAGPLADLPARADVVIVRAGDAGAVMVPRDRQREEMASDYYYGGMVVTRTGKLHPALYYKGLLDAARRRGIALIDQTPAGRITKLPGGFSIETARGAIAC